MNHSSPTPLGATTDTGRPHADSPRRPGRLMVDAPTRAFHWLFALSFAGAWITAESERWRALHETLGYAFGGLLLLRLAYGLLGPRPARLGALWQRVAGLGDWLRRARGGQPDLKRALSLSMGAVVLGLLALALPLALSGHAAQAEWLGLGHALEELHEFLANGALTLVLAHLSLIALLSLLRGKNLALPMLSGRASEPGPDLVKASRGWLALLLLLAYLSFVAWMSWPAPPGDARADADAQPLSMRSQVHHEDEED
ncbi:MAG: cytochrome b/b6 domain-containing protein [Roseateles sp.]